LAALQSAAGTHPRPPPARGRAALPPRQVLHCCALLAPNQDAAFMLSILWSTIQLLMSNFFITIHELRFKWLSSLRYLSALYYSFEGLSRAEFGGAAFDCSGGVDAASVTFLRELLPNSKLMSSSAVTNALTNPGRDCVARTDALLEYHGFTRAFPDTVGILFFYWVVTHACTYAAMVLVSRKERR
jgi:hypothetical protein